MNPLLYSNSDSSSHSSLCPLIANYLKQSGSLPPLESASIPELREKFNERYKEFNETAPAYDLIIRDEVAMTSQGATALRIYQPQREATNPIDRALIFFHGGGFVFGNIDSLECYCRELAHSTQSMVISAAYPLAPEQPFPAAPEAAYEVTCWIHNYLSEYATDIHRLFIAGSSAGATIAAVVSMLIRDRGGPKISGQILLCPLTDTNFNTPSYLTNGIGYNLTREQCIWFISQYCQDPSMRSSPLLAPLQATHLKDLPPALVVTAEFDPLRDEGIAYAKRLREAGIICLDRCYRGMVHGFPTFPIELPEKRDVLEQIQQFMKKPHDILLEPYPLNSLLTLKNRIAMAPMTRSFAYNDLAPTQAMAEYYARRAEAGLIITEGTIIRPDGLGYPNIPGLFTENQIDKWRMVTSEVHANHGLIFSQIWHVGRVSHPNFLGGALPVSASATLMQGKVHRSENLFYGESRALTTDEINAVTHDYAVAAKNAIKAGFDGVEIHGANGYLVDQFLHHHTNKRNDHYGETPENMARFALEVVRACGGAIGYERVGLRLSPGAYLNEMLGDPRDAKVFQYLLDQLHAYPIAYVHVGNFDDSKTFPELDHLTMSAFIRAHYRGTLIASGSYSLEHARQAIAEGKFDLLAQGRPFLANPDLIQKIREKLALNPYDLNMLNHLD